jgi:MtN3 and saliva related transmembrane protein
MTVAECNVSQQSHRRTNNEQADSGAELALARPRRAPSAKGTAAMAEAMVEAIGTAGAVLTTVCWVPQAIKIIRERDTRAISLSGTTLSVLGLLLWLVYGLALLDRPLIASSLITFAITAVILALKIRHG